MESITSIPKSPSVGDAQAVPPAPWWAVKAPVLASLGADGRKLHQWAILERAGAILRADVKWHTIDFCFALEEAAAQLRAEGKL